MLETILMLAPVVGVMSLVVIGWIFDAQLRERGNRNTIQYSVHKTYAMNARDNSIVEVI